MTVSIRSSYLTPPLVRGGVKWDDGNDTVILFDSPQGQGGAQLGIYQINYIMPSPLSLLLFINYLFIFCKERLFLI